MPQTEGNHSQLGVGHLNHGEYNHQWALLMGLIGIVGKV